MCFCRTLSRSRSQLNFMLSLILSQGTPKFIWKIITITYWGLYTKGSEDSRENSHLDRIVVLVTTVEHKQKR